MIGRSRWTGYALLAPALVAVGFLIMYPLYLVVATSFRQGKTLNVLRLSELPFGLANYRTMLASEATWHAADATFQTYGGFAFAKEYDIERKWREVRLYQTAPISTNLILAYIGQHVLGMPRSF